MTTTIKTSKEQQKMKNNNNNNDIQSSLSQRRRRKAAVTAAVRITTSDDEGSSSGGCCSEGGKVSFGEVRIRCHERVLNRRVSSKFAGLELGWEHNTSIRHNLEDYEQLKTEERQQRESRKTSSSSSTDAKSSSKSTPRRFTVHERLHKLSEYGYPSKEVLALERQKRIAKRKAAAIRAAAAELEEDTKRFNICWGNRKRKQIMRKSGCFADKKLPTFMQKIKEQCEFYAENQGAMRM